MNRMFNIPIKTQDVKRIAWHPTEDILASASYDNNLKMYRYGCVF